MYNMGTFIKDLRETYNLSQGELATLAGVGKSTLSDLESNRHIPRTNTVLAIFQALINLNNK